MDQSIKDLIVKLDILCNYVDDSLAIEPHLTLTNINVIKSHITESRKLMAGVWAMEGRGLR